MTLRTTLRIVQPLSSPQAMELLSITEDLLLQQTLLWKLTQPIDFTVLLEAAGLMDFTLREDV